MKSLAEKIREQRKKQGYTLQELADKSNCSKSYLWEIENSKLLRPSGIKLGNIAEVLGVTVDFLVSDNRLNAEVTEQENFLVSKFRQLSAKRKQQVLKFIDIIKD
jgi:transcriptional regulator with XRE-family HTH domain